MTKYVEQHQFTFDKAFGEEFSNQDIYTESVQPLIEFALDGGRVSCFAYGQTGSGKTYTMIGTEKSTGIYALAADDIFRYIRN